MIGITGTNGKTTTTYLIKHLLEAQGAKVGLIGTNQNLIGDEIVETDRTTPESYELHALFIAWWKPAAPTASWRFHHILWCSTACTASGLQWARSPT